MRFRRFRNEIDHRLFGSLIIFGVDRSPREVLGPRIDDMLRLGPHCIDRAEAATGYIWNEPTVVEYRELIEWHG